MSTFDGKSSPFDAPPEQRFPPTPLAPAPEPTPSPTAVDPHQGKRKEKQEDRVAAQQKPKKSKLSASSAGKDDKARPSGDGAASSPESHKFAFAAYAASPDPLSAPKPKKKVSSMRWHCRKTGQDVPLSTCSTMWTVPAEEDPHQLFGTLAFRQANANEACKEERRGQLRGPGLMSVHG